MYDDLARTQNPTALEWFVLHAVIPSVLVTAAFHWKPPIATAASTAPTSVERFFTVCVITPPPPIPDVFPTLVRMPRPIYPEAMRRAGIEGRVVLKALVNTSGRVDASSILVLRATHVQFVVPAREALSAALFHPGWFGGRRMNAWITIAIDFPDSSE
jgi:TonB family protein